MIELKDQMNRTMRLGEYPKRIVSLVPSQTELLFDLGITDEVVGITKFCVHPKHWFETKTRIGGTKQIDIEKVKALNPDLIIGNKEENTKEDILQLEKICPVWMSDIFTLEDSCRMILEIGKITNRLNKAESLVRDITISFNEIIPISRKLKVAYLIWKNPYLIAGKSTFIDDIISKCGLINITNEIRYPEWNFERDASPDFIFLSSEPFPFKEKDVEELQKQFQYAKILLVDGEMFSWYGSRLKYSAHYLIEILKLL